MKTIEFEYEGKPVKIHVPDEFRFAVGDLLNLKRDPKGLLLTNERTGDECMIPIPA